VCKDFFFRTPDISNRRFTRATDRIRETGITKHDKTGSKGRTPIPELQQKLVRDHINSAPKYSSHHPLQYNPEKKYLPHFSIIHMNYIYAGM
jgi:hypothetical protein